MKAFTAEHREHLMRLYMSGAAPVRECAQCEGVMVGRSKLGTKCECGSNRGRWYYCPEGSLVVGAEESL